MPSELPSDAHPAAEIEPVGTTPHGDVLAVVHQPSGLRVAVGTGSATQMASRLEWLHRRARLDQHRDREPARGVGAGEKPAQDLPQRLPQPPVPGRWLGGRHSGLGRRMALHPLQANAISPGTVAPEGLSGPLIYAGTGQLDEFNGRAVSGAIVLMEMNSGRNWINAANLGARALIDGLSQDVIARDDRLIKLIPQHLMNFDEAAHDALNAERQHAVPARWVDSAAACETFKPEYSFYAKQECGSATTSATQHR